MLLLLSEIMFVSLAFIVGDITAPSLFYGGAVVLLGCCLSLWSKGYMPPKLGESFEVLGPWRFLRHPGVLSRFLMVFGALLIARTPWLFAAAMLVLGWNYQQLVRRGDLLLRQVLGPTFVQYRMFVPSFVPQFLPARLPHPSLRATGTTPWNTKRLIRGGLFSPLTKNFVVLGVCLLLYGWLQGGLSPWWVRSVAILILTGAACRGALEFPQFAKVSRRLLSR